MSGYSEMLAYLQDSHRVETRRWWDGVVGGELGPEERAKAERLAPIVTSYLSGATTKEEYEHELAAASVPQP